MLSLKNIHAGYDGRPVLHDATLEIADGEFVGLVGPNGCGKTTLLRVISGVLTAQSGNVRLLGRALDSFDRRELARTVAMLPQELSLDLGFTVEEVARMGRFAHQARFGRESAADRAAARRAMEMAEVLQLADRPVTELSGGERQRAFIALCLAQEPKLLLLDEPNNHLDLGHQLSILNLIAGLNRDAGLTVAATFHDLNLAAEYCDRLVVIDAGRIAAVGPPGDVLTADRILQVFGVRVVIEPNPLSGKPHVVYAASSRRRAD